MMILARQLKQLANNAPEGIRYVPSDDNITDVRCEIDGPVGTPYEGGVFQMKLILTSDFPNAPPKGFFTTKIFHPNIAPSGDICVNTLKKDWKPEHTLSHVLQVIRCLLIVPFPESSLNDDAGKLFMESYDEYARKARLMTSIHAVSKSTSLGPSSATSASTTLIPLSTGTATSLLSSSSSASSSSSSSSSPPLQSDSSTEQASTENASHEEGGSKLSKTASAVASSSSNSSSSSTTSSISSSSKENGAAETITGKKAAFASDKDGGASKKKSLKRL